MTTESYRAAMRAPIYSHNGGASVNHGTGLHYVEDEEDMNDFLRKDNAFTALGRVVLWLLAIPVVVALAVTAIYILGRLP